jgi:hypothetical protein
VLDCHRLFGDFQITLKKREVKDHYIISTLQLKVRRYKLVEMPHSYLQQLGFPAYSSWYGLMMAVL